MKVTTPAVVEVPEAADTVSLAPRLETKVTVLPESGLEFASFNVMVRVEVLVPFAGIELELAARVETVELTAPGE